MNDKSSQLATSPFSISPSLSVSLYVRSGVCSERSTSFEVCVLSWDDSSCWDGPHREQPNAPVEGGSPALNNATLISALKSLLWASSSGPKQEIETAAFYQGIRKFLWRVLVLFGGRYATLPAHPGGGQQRDKGAGRVSDLFWLPNLSILTHTLICESVQSLSKQPVLSPPR